MSLSVAAKEFVPKTITNNDHTQLKISLSVNVPEFIPKTEHTPTNSSNTINTKNDSVESSNSTLSLINAKKETKELRTQTKEKLSKKFSKEKTKPRHDTEWAKDAVDIPMSLSFSARNDYGWFHRDLPKEDHNTILKKKALKKSDSYQFNLTQKSISLRTKAEQKELVRTFSLRHAQKENEGVDVKDYVQHQDKVNCDITSHNKLSWSAIVSNPASKEKLTKKASMNSFHQQQQQHLEARINRREKGLSPNTGHSRDLRTKSYDLERDKKTKLNKLKKSTSVLGTLEQQIHLNSPKKTLLQQHATRHHHVLSQSKSVGSSLDFLLSGKPKLKIERKNLVLQAKLSAGINRQKDPEHLHNWFSKDLPKTIEKLSTSSLQTDDGDTEMTKTASQDGKKVTIKETDTLVKRKLTRTSKKVFSPMSNVTNFTNKIISAATLNDDYFTNEKYDADSTKRNSGAWSEDEITASSIDNETHNCNENDSMESRSQSARARGVDVSEETASTPPSSSAVLSYSAILKKTGPATVKFEENDDRAGETPREKGVSPFTGEEIRLFKKAKKKEKKKMKKQKKMAEFSKINKENPDKTKTTTTPVKRSQQEMSLNISDMFDKLLVAPTSTSNSFKHSKKSKPKKLVISTGVVSVVSGLAKKNTTDGKKTARNKYGGTSIIMDGATPIIKRGKERQTPKKKKPTLLKKIIKAERERKQLLQKSILQENDRQEESIVPLGLDEKSELQPVVDIVEPSQETQVSMVTPAPLVAEKVDEDEKPSTMVTRAPLTDLPENIQKQIHSRKFREYCDHVLTKEINTLTHELLITLQKFQDRVYHEQPAKYKQRRRFVLGLREVLKHTKLKRMKAIIFAPNLERISSEGGLDDYLRNIISLCKELEIPKIFAMNRHALGKTLKKKAPVSVIGIFSYDGAEEVYKQLSEHVDVARNVYKEKVQHIMKITTDQLQEEQQPPSDRDTLCINDNAIHSPPLMVNDEAEQLKRKMLTNFTRNEFQLT